MADGTFPHLGKRATDQQDEPPKWESALEPDSLVDRLIAEFNAKFFVLNEHGKAVIYAPRHDPIMNRKYYDRMSFEDFEKLYRNRFIQIGVEKDGTPIRRRVAPVWLNHSDRHQYIGGVVFDPSGREIAPDVLNLWQSFAVEPREGDWSKLRQHILDVICNYEQALNEYLLDWMADLVQNPAKQGEVAIVLRGPEGSGKGILARAVKYLFGQHGLAISNAKHLIGNFNGHLRDAVFLFADEAFYAGDKQHVGVLKALITEPHLTIEGKYLNAVQMPNFLHVMMASNEEWVVPASLDSRRWLVIDVQGNKINAHGYFGAIQKQLDDGGHAAMLHDLLNRDLSKSNLRAVPVTDALQTQRKMSLDTTHRWWVDCLHREYVFQSRLGLEDHFGQWRDFLTTELLFASYSRYCTEARERRPLSRELFGRWMVSAGAKPARLRKQAVGEHMVDATTTDGRTSRVADLVIHPLPTGYNLGDLATARRVFNKASGLTVDWGEAVEECSG
jgi:hypothetical protein